MALKNFFVSIQATYAHVNIALFSQGSSIDTIVQDDIRASSHLVMHLDTLLQRNNLTLSDIAFIAMDKGPGAFTSLRVAIATINGIAFACRIPVIGIDGLDALSFQALGIMQQKNTLPHTYIIVALLNAYNNDVYYAVTQISGGQSELLEKGCQNSGQLFAQLGQRHTNTPILFTGNGTPLHQTLITQLFGQQLLDDPLPLATCSAQSIGVLADKQFLADQSILSHKIEPNYIKSQHFAIRTPMFSAQRS